MLCPRSKRCRGLFVHPNSAIEMRVASAMVQVHGGKTLSLGRGGPWASSSDSQAKPDESSRCPLGPRPTGKARWAPPHPRGFLPRIKSGVGGDPNPLAGEDRLPRKLPSMSLPEPLQCPIAGFGVHCGRASECEPEDRSEGQRDKKGGPRGPPWVECLMGSELYPLGLSGL